MNRYTYGLNGPVANIDPDGRKTVSPGINRNWYISWNTVYGSGGDDGSDSAIYCIPGSVDSCLYESPNAGSGISVFPPDGSDGGGLGGEVNGLPTFGNFPTQLPFALPWQNQNCGDFAPCGSQPGNALAPNNSGPPFTNHGGLDSLFELFGLHVPYLDGLIDPELRLFGTHYCGKGGGGNVLGGNDPACHAHDVCYDDHHLGFW